MDTDSDIIDSEYVEKFIVDDELILEEDHDLVSLQERIYGYDVKTLDSELKDVTFNGTSSKFCRFEEVSASDTTSNDVLCNDNNNKISNLYSLERSHK